MLDLVQRWRIVYARGAGARDLAQRAELEAWERAVVAARLPVVGAAAGRPRLGFAIPLALGLTAGAERFDLPLTERLTAATLRSALEPVVPADHRIVEWHDVWVGEPSLVSQVAAADYRLVVRPGGGPRGEVEDTPAQGTPTPDSLVPDALEGACRRLLASARVERVRRKADREIAYDLRPFVLALRAEGADPRLALWMRLAADPAGGVGRPDAVIAAVGDAAGVPLVMVEGHRERLWLVDELPAQPT